MWKVITLFVFSLYAAFSVAQSECTGFGEIKGRVLDDKNNPVTNALVTILHEECNIVGIAPTAVTDDTGLFTLARVPAGRTGVYARKEEGGYPDTRMLIYKDDSVVIPKVLVRANETTTEVIVRLGKRGGILMGKITDSETGQPVISARLSLARPGDAEPLLSSSSDTKGKFRFVVPPRPIRFEVRSPGYKTWPSSVSGQLRRGIIKIHSNEIKQINVQLQKLPKAQ